ncbi:hypothetical protein VTO42DRAFT_466 [Malbranchea cinnamomea]
MSLTLVNDKEPLPPHSSPAHRQPARLRRPRRPTGAIRLQTPTTKRTSPPCYQHSAPHATRHHHPNIAISQSSTSRTPPLTRAAHCTRPIQTVALQSTPMLNHWVTKSPCSGKKNVNSAFVGTRLGQETRARGVKQLLVAVLTTDHCVSTSVRIPANLGVAGEDGRIILVEDSCSTFAKGPYDAATVHGVSVETLRGEFAEIWKTADVVAELKRFA